MKVSSGQSAICVSVWERHRGSKQALVVFRTLRDATYEGLLDIERDSSRGRRWRRTDVPTLTVSLRWSYLPRLASQTGTACLEVIL